MEAFAKALHELSKQLTTVQEQQSEARSELEQELRDAEFAPYSRDLSQVKGLEMALDEHDSKAESLECLKQQILEVVELYELEEDAIVDMKD